MVLLVSEPSHTDICDSVPVQFLHQTVLVRFLNFAISVLSGPVRVGSEPLLTTMRVYMFRELKERGKKKRGNIYTHLPGLFIFESILTGLIIKTYFNEPKENIKMKTFIVLLYQ